MAAPAQQMNARLAAFMAGDLVKAINKRAGGISVQVAAEKDLKTKRIPSGIYSLDCALGGGWVVGGVNDLYGPESGGKTTNALRAIAEGQKLCGNCWTPGSAEVACACEDYRLVTSAYLDVEGTLDLGWAQKVGVRLGDLLHSKPETAEETLDILEGFIRSGTFDIIALDSLAFLTPAQEIKESTSKDLMGVQARAVGKGIRKLTAAMNCMENTQSVKRRPTLFFTNQIRMKLGVMFGDPETTPSGNAPKFAATTSVRFGKGKYDMPNGGISKPTQALFTFKVKKNKSAVPNCEGEYIMALSQIENKVLGSIIDEPQMMSDAKKMNLLTGGGSSWKFMEDTYRKQDDLEFRLMHEPEFKAKAKAFLMHKFIEF